jgi:malate dehydrogenase (oxaloacetate-decarboxylating)
MAYTPGVGIVCEEIHKNEKLADIYTLRARSIAIVSDGSIFDCPSRNLLPLMDWLIAQIKYFSNYDAFPFAVS